ncbi:MAG: thiosulfate oxidation carrier protein SoxY [Pseudomonadota bacterium]
MSHSRRQWLRMSGAAVTLLSIPLPAIATPAALAQAQAQAYGERPIRDGRITLTVPALAENGHSVALAVSVDSPMTERDHVQRIDVWAEKNPLPLIGRFELSPLSGSAAVRTRIRLADSQTLSAVATLSDGTLWRASAQTIVTLAACTDFLI